MKNLHDPATLKANYKLNGTTDIATGKSKDSSGHGNHLSSTGTEKFDTNINGKQTRKFEDGTSEVQSLTGTTDGQFLDDSLSVVSAATYADIPCCEFDLGDYTSTVSIDFDTNDWDISITFAGFDTPTNGTNSNVFGEDTFAVWATGTLNIKMETSAGGVIAYFYNAGIHGAHSIIRSFGTIPFDGSIHTLRAVRTSGVITLYTDGTPVDVTDVTGTDFGTLPEFGAFSPKNHGVTYNLKMINAFVSVNGVEQINWNFDETAGDAIEDSSGAGNTATLIPVEGSGNVAGIARIRNATVDGVSSHFAEYGGTVQSLPAELIIDGTFDVGISNWQSTDSAIAWVDNTIKSVGAFIGFYTYYNPEVLTVGKSYHLEFDLLDAPSDVLNVSIGLQTVLPLGGNATLGHYSVDTAPLVDTVPLTFEHGGVSSNIQLDNVTLKEIAPSGTRYIPALTDGSGLAADGLPITNLGGFVHNGAPVTIQQTDASLLTNDFWSSNGSTFDKKSYQDIIDHDNTEDVYFVKEEIDGVTYIKEAGTEEVDGIFTSLDTTLDFDPNNFTVVGRFNSDDYYTGYKRTLFEKVNSGTDYLINIALEGNQDKVITFTGVNGTKGITSSTTIVTDQQEHTFACSFDGTYWKLYIDGVLDTTVSDPVVITNLSNGCYTGKDVTDKFDGYIGDLKVYETVLTASEIGILQEDMSNPPTMSEPIVPALYGDNSGQYINLGIKPTSLDRVEIDLDFVGIGRTYFHGEFDSGNMFFLGLYGGYIRYGFGTLNLETSVKGEGRMTLALDVDGVYYNGTKIADIIDYGSWSSTADFWIFNRNINGFGYEGNIYGVKYWQNGVLVRDMSPYSGGRMYDRINGTIYSNDGTGTLVTKQIPNKKETGLVFSTRDGINDLTRATTIENNGAIVGNGMTFDGTNYIGIPNPIPVSNRFTVSTIINRHRLSGTSQTIYSRTNYGTGGYRIYISNTERLIIGEDSGDQTTHNTGYNIRDNKKYHIVVTHDGSNLIVYVNGENIYESATGSISSYSGTSHIGKTSGANWYFVGNISKLEEYNEAKSAEWVAQDYENEAKYW